MNEGDTFKTMCKREKDRKTLIILHDYNDNRRFLWWIEGNVRQGEVCLMYPTEYIGKSTKEEVKKYTTIANAI